MRTQKIFDQLLFFMNLYQHAKNQFIASAHPPDAVNYSVLSPERFSITFLIFMNL